MEYSVVGGSLFVFVAIYINIYIYILFYYGVQTWTSFVGMFFVDQISGVELCAFRGFGLGNWHWVP